MNSSYQPLILTTNGYQLENGELLNRRHLCQKKLGEGAFSNVYKLKDIQQKRCVAAKILNHGCKRDAEGEIKIMKTISDELLRDGSTSTVNVVSLIDSFDITGGFTCITMKQQGVNLLDFTELMKVKGPGLPLPITKGILRQLLEGLDFLHKKCGVIHTDIKPENLVLCRHQPGYVVCELQRPKLLGIKGDSKKESTGRNRSISLLKAVVESIRNSGPQIQIGNATGTYRGNTREENEETTDTDGRNAEGMGSDGKSLSKREAMEDLKIMLIDFGSAQYINEEEVTTANDRIQTLEYRCPESILLSEKYFGPVVDIWSAACVAFELATGKYLFEPPHTTNATKYHSDHSCDIDRDIAHLKLIAHLVRIPSSMITKSKLKPTLVKRRKEFENTPRTYTFHQLLKDKYRYKCGSTVPAYSDDQEVDGFANFLDFMLQADPAHRPSAADCLQHNWLNC